MTATGVRSRGRAAALTVLASGFLATTLFSATPADASSDDAARNPVKVVISLSKQRMWVYRGAKLVSSSPVSTGKRGHRTPAGVYSIIQKNRHHRSNLYSNAPMPFMQRITWSGIALHQGRLPGYAASHGCIRMPYKMSRNLWKMTRLGAPVIITRGVSQPTPIAHPALFDFSPSRRASTDLFGENYMGARLGSGVSAIMAAAFDIEIDMDRPELDTPIEKQPLRMVITKRTGFQKIKEAQRLLGKIGHDAGGIDGRFGSRTAAAVKAFNEARGVKTAGLVDDELMTALYAAAGEPALDAHLYVRRGFRDFFDMPVGLKDPEKPLGTHVFTAQYFDKPEVEEGAEPKGARVDWTAITVAAADDGATAKDALDRVLLPEAARERIEAMLTPDSSIIVSDAGVSLETGRGTDFIVQPR